MSDTTKKNEMDTPLAPVANTGDTASVASLRIQAERKMRSPLSDHTTSQLINHGEKFCEAHGITNDEDVRAFRLGSQLAGPETEWDTVEGLTEAEKDILKKEAENKWEQPKMLYFIVAICSLCATVQGMDETVVNGAQAFYKTQFGIGSSDARDTWLLGLTNGAPYIACALLGCWLTHPLNKFFGRRGTLALCQGVMVLACIWQAFTDSWYHLAIARFALGLALGPISATTPMFSAECAPQKLRGALVMQWQLWTAFGIMLGYASDLAFYNVANRWGITGLNWRLMLASAAIPAMGVFCCIWLIPESPRWQLSKGRHKAAFEGTCKLRFSPVQAARDVVLAAAMIDAEKASSLKGGYKELVTVRRNRNAFIASEITMFMQQFCGVNVVAYYSTEILLGAGFDTQMALLCSLSFGACGFICSWLAFKTIDTFGRRNLLLTTFPLMSFFLLWTAVAFLAPEEPLARRIGLILTGLLCFSAVYAPGEGPVPFTYSAEAYPQYIRSKGMSCATATTWFFNFLLAVTWPSLESAMTATGGFSFYAGWNVVGFFLVLFFLPETKGLSLEELDQVFDVPLRSIIRYGWEQAGYFWRVTVFRGKGEKPRAPHHIHHHPHDGNPITTTNGDESSAVHVAHAESEISPDPTNRV